MRRALGVAMVLAAVVLAFFRKGWMVQGGV